MVGRSLFSLLAIAAVAIQSCAASFNENTYKIKASTYGSLAVSEAGPGALVEVFDGGEYQEWELRPASRPDHFEIALPRSPLYVAPAQEGPFVQLRFQPYEWRFQRNPDGQYTIERTDKEEEPWTLTVSPIRIFPPRAATAPAGAPYPRETWSLIRADGSQQETRNHCGPRRLSRNSFYPQ